MDESLISPGCDTNPQAGWRYVLALYNSILASAEGKTELALTEKNVEPIFKSWQRQGLNLGPCGWKPEILPTVPITLPTLLYTYWEVI